MKGMMKYLMAACMAAFAFISVSGASKSEEIFIVPECDKSSYYSNETGKLVLWLYTQNPNIGGIGEISPVNIDNGKFSFISKVSDSQPFTQKKYKGKDYYVAPLVTYAFTISESGKYKITGGEYQIRLRTPVIVRDPFWGDVQTYQSSSRQVRSEDLTVKVKSLPENNSGGAFSGAVGNYSIDVEVPRGQIVINEPATVIIAIEGNGLIGDDTMPDYHGAFSDKVKMKSMNESNDYYYDGNNVRSRKVLECEVIPQVLDNCEIGAIEFGFFNPISGKYETIKSNPVKLNVKSSTVRITPFEV